MLKDIKIKLKTMWMLDSEWESNVPHPYTISHGLWVTNGLNIEGDLLIYTFVCLSSDHPDLKPGDTRRMVEVQIMHLCHEVKLVSMPKIEYKK